MSLRYSSLILALCVVIAPLVVAAPATAQSTNGRWVMPRTANGHPDLQGNWSNATLTPIQRPRDQSLVVSLEAGAARAQEQADYVARRTPMQFLDKRSVLAMNQKKHPSRCKRSECCLRFVFSGDANSRPRLLP